MKILFSLFIITVFISCQKNSANIPPITPPGITDSFTVTVNNGYGTGKYKTGDTIHIWSKELTATQVLIPGLATILY